MSLLQVAAKEWWPTAAVSWSVNITSQVWKPAGFCPAVPRHQEWVTSPLVDWQNRSVQGWLTGQPAAATVHHQQARLIIGPIPWGHSGPLCHALSLLLLSSSSCTSMCRRRATVAAVATPGEWQCKTARSGEWARHFSNASCWSSSQIPSLA